MYQHLLMADYVVLVEPIYITNSNSWVFVRPGVEGPIAVDQVIDSKHVLQFPQICACCGEPPNKNIFSNEVDGIRWSIPYCEQCSAHSKEYSNIHFPNVMKSRLNRVKNLMKPSCANMGSVVEYKGTIWININEIKNPGDEIPPLKVEMNGEPKVNLLSEISVKFPMRKFHQFKFFNKKFAEQFAFSNNGYVKDHYYVTNEKSNNQPSLIVTK